MAQDGSSPLARGTWYRLTVLALPLRLIPARAGNMYPLVPQRYLPPAHPRSRGEHVSLPLSDSLDDGSSPLARGTFDAEDTGDFALRLIPARAGNIVRGLSNVSGGAAHPRSRGEHTC